MQFNILRKWDFIIFSSLRYIFESEIFRFPFSTKKKPNVESEMWKNKVQKIVDKLRKLYMNGTGI